MAKLINLDKIKHYMENVDIDVCIAHTRTNFMYVSGYIPHFGGERSYNLTMGGNPYINFAVLPIEKMQERFLVTNPNDYGGLIKKDAWITDYRLAGEKWGVDGLDLEIDEDPIISLIDGLKERGLEKSKIGIEMDHMFKPMYDKIKKYLPAAKLKNFSPFFLKARMYKTDEEIKRIKTAMKILEKCFIDTWKKVELGMTEIEFERIFKKIGLDQGGMVTGIHVGFGPKSATTLTPTNLKLKKGDIISLDAVVNYEGYLADINKDSIFGEEPNKELREMSDPIVKANQKMRESLKPGLKASELYEIGKKVMDDANVLVSLESLGHGVGLQTHELPFIGPWDHTPLEKNMVITIEVNSKRYGLARNSAEDMVIITDDGHELISPIPNELRIL